MIWNCLSPWIMASVGVTYNLESTMESNLFQRSMTLETSTTLTLFDNSAMLLDRRGTIISWSLCVSRGLTYSTRQLATSWKILIKTVEIPLCFDLSGGNFFLRERKFVESCLNSVSKKILFQSCLSIHYYVFKVRIRTYCVDLLLTDDSLKQNRTAAKYRTTKK